MIAAGAVRVQALRRAFIPEMVAPMNAITLLPTKPGCPTAPRTLIMMPPMNAPTILRTMSRKTPEVATRYERRVPISRGKWPSSPVRRRRRARRRASAFVRIGIIVFVGRDPAVRVRDGGEAAAGVVVVLHRAA